MSVFTGSVQLGGFLCGLYLACLFELYHSGDDTNDRANSKRGDKEIHAEKCFSKDRKTKEECSRNRAANRSNDDVKRLEKIYEDNATGKCKNTAGDPKEDLTLKECNLLPFHCRPKCNVKSRDKAACRTDDKDRKLVYRIGKSPTDDRAYKAGDRGKVDPFGKPLDIFKNKGGENNVAERATADSRRERKLDAKDAIAVKRKHQKCKTNAKHSEKGSRHLSVNICDLFCCLCDVAKDLVHIYSCPSCFTTFYFIKADATPAFPCVRSRYFLCI